MTTANRRARLLEYVPWMARDYITNLAPGTAIVVLLIGIAAMAPAMALSGAAQFGNVPAEIAAQVLRILVPWLVVIGVLFATNGIIANDRRHGYYRFLFAKPLSPLRFYAMLFAVHGVGLLAVTLLLMGIWSLAVRPMFPLELLAIVTIMYIAYGGLGFLLSAAWRFDWLSLVSVLLLANVGWAVWGNAQGLRHWLLYLLPPVNRESHLYGLLSRSGGALPWESIAWLLGYGLICFALGLLVLRKRPLGTS